MKENIEYMNSGVKEILEKDRNKLNTLPKKELIEIILIAKQQFNIFQHELEEFVYNKLLRRYDKK